MTTSAMRPTAGTSVISNPTLLTQTASPSWKSEKGR